MKTKLELVPQPEKLNFSGKWLKFGGITNMPGFISREFGIKRAGYKSSNCFTLIKQPGSGGINRIGVKAGRISVQGDVYSGYAALVQLLKQKPGYIPEVSVTEKFRFPFRAYHLDMPRGGVPHPGYFRKLLRLLFMFKYNYFALYFEDLFPWKDYPRIGAHRGRLSRPELNEVIRYGRKLGIEVFPSLELTGHMSRFFEFPELKKYVEWDTACKGDTLNVSDPSAVKFACGLLEDACEFFREARYIHIGGDEPWTLGRGKSLDKTGRFKGPELYGLHHEKLLKIVRKHGKEPMMWNDMFYGKHLPAKAKPAWLKLLKNKIWKEPVMANWDYTPGDKSYFYKLIKPFEGSRQLLCPGFSNWRTFYPNFEKAIANLKGFLAGAEKFGLDRKIMGFMTTSWGDDGAECLYSHVEPLLLATMEIAEGNGRWKEKWLKLSGESRKVLEARIDFGRPGAGYSIKKVLFENMKLDGRTEKLWKSILARYRNVNLPAELRLVYDLMDLGYKRQAGRETSAQISAVCRKYIEMWLKERKKANLDVVVDRFSSMQSRHFLK